MSIVLKALEKAEKEVHNRLKNQITVQPDIEELPSLRNMEQSTITIVRIDEQSQLEEIKHPSPKIDIKTEKKSRIKENPYISIKPHTKLFFRNKLVIFWGILCVGIAGLLWTNWWLNKQTSETSVPITNSSSEISSPSKIAAIKDILLEPTPPKLKITGVMWDQQEPIALINGKFLKQGEDILGAKIVKIQPRDVTVLYKEKEFTISVE